MAASNFDACLTMTLGFEGGYVDNPADPGGATKFGITRATLARSRGHAVTKADVQALTRAEAAAIYRASYWRAVRGDELPEGIDAILFDHAVNSGAAASARTLARVLGEFAREKFDDALIAACRRADRATLVRRLCAERLRFLERLRTFPAFGRGWTRRVRTLEAGALKMAARAKPAPLTASVVKLPFTTQEIPMPLKGYRTILVGLLIALGPPALQYLGAVDWNAIIGPTGAFFVSGLVTIAMRAITSTPLASSSSEKPAP